MKLNPEQLISALKKGVVNRKFVIFGPEGSVATTTLKSLLSYLKQSNDLDVEEMQYAAVKDDIAAVRDGLRSRSLFGGQKVIVITEVSGVIVKGLVELYKQPLEHGMLIVVAGDLGKTSPLRKLGEEAQDIATIACYKPDIKAMHVMVKTKLQDLALQHDSSVVAMIAEMLPTNAMIVDSELEKLALYKGENRHVTAEDITACFAYSGEASLDDLIYAIVSRDAKMRAKQLQKLLYSDLNFMLVIRSLLNFFNKLLQVHVASSSNNITSQVAIQSLKPPLFFKSRDNMVLACNNFSLNQTKTIVARLVELERRCKGGAIDNKLLLQHFLLRAI